MKKIAYNACYGGFSLSPKALLEYAKLKGIDNLFFYKQTKYSYKDGEPEYELVPIEKASSLFTYAVTEYLGETSNNLNGYYSPKLTRDDSDLIKVIEQLGSKVSSGSCAKIEIAEVSGKWRIDEYDGYESVEQPDDIEWND